jgi:hypothetical protein
MIHVAQCGLRTCEEKETLRFHVDGKIGRVPWVAFSPVIDRV